MSDRDRALSLDASEITRAIGRLVGDAPEIADGAVKRVALQVVRVAKDKIPVDTGSLKAAMTAEGVGWQEGPDPVPKGGRAPQPFAANPEAGEAVIYNSMDYAAAVHEDMETEHKTRGEAKFLENALREVGSDPETLRKIAEHVRNQIARRP